MYLIDTNVISECRKRDRANKGVRLFFEEASSNDSFLCLSVITIGELRRGVELIRHRGDTRQANQLEKWLTTIVEDYDDRILNFTSDDAQLWGRLRVPRYENAIDKQIAATALSNDLTLVTRNISDFDGFGIRLINPFL
ncbi:MAG: type II toxin-antitoxin system VapC family toxin [Pseudomonadota bacterium]